MLDRRRGVTCARQARDSNGPVPYVASIVVNTGWIGGGFGVGQRIPLKMTRAMVRAALGGSLDSVETIHDPIFNLRVPSFCPEVPADLLTPSRVWKDKGSYQASALKLAQLFKKNFEQYRDQTTAEVVIAGPQ